MILGLNHITLSVSDLEKSFNFYTKILGCQPIARWKVLICWLGNFGYVYL